MARGTKLRRAPRNARQTLACEVLEVRALLAATVAVSDATLSEGNNGTTNMVFTVTRGGDDALSTLEVAYTTSNGTATAGSDFSAQTGTVTIAPGAAAATISIPVTGDMLAESDEQFSVNLTGVNVIGPGATLGTRTDLPNAESPYSVAIGDLNGDGRPDLAMANQNANTISVRFNTTSPGATTPTFSGQTDFAAGVTPRNIAICDFNGDGRPDIAAANISASTISVFLNTTTPGATSPSLAAKVDFATGAGPHSLVTVDMNGDGKADLVTSNLDDNTVGVALNTTTPGATVPTFATRSLFATDLNPRNVAVGDINGDGRPDLVTANYHSTTVSVLLNTTAVGASAMSFATKTDFTCGTTPFYVAIGDLNNDGKPDLAVAMISNPNVAVLLNSTAGGATTPSFNPKTDIATGPNPLAVNINDFNKDGKLDLVVLDQNSRFVSVFVNKTVAGSSQLVLAARTDSAIGIGAHALATGDLNGDGKIDVVTANSTSNDVSVLLNSTVLPTAAFEVSAKSDFTTETSPFSVSAGDLNGDGKPDLAVADWGAGKISVLLNTSTPGATTPTFANKVDFTAGALPRSIAIGDLNGDGRPDLAAVNLISYSVSVFLNTMTPGASVAAFSAKTDFATGTKPVSIAIGDMNGDGKADLAIANGFESSASVLMNTTAGGATTPSFAPRSTVSISGAVRSIAIGDLNGDGKPDLALANYSSTSVTVLLNTTTPGATSATFAPKSEFQTGSLPISAAISDLNGDGKLDLAVANQGSSTVSVFLNNAVVGATVASFAGKTDFATGTKPWGIAVGDLNGDGKPDLAVPTETNNTVSILINNTSLGGASAFLGKIDRATGNFPTAVAMADFNLDGRRDLAVSNLSSSSVSVLLNSPVVTLDGTGVGTITNDDHVPVFTSSATASFAENGTGTVLTVTATDADLPAQTITYSLSGGADRALFTLTNGGLLTFKNSPNFEAPGDAGTDNVYNIQVTANDGAGNTTTQNVAITVTPVNDNTPFFTSNAAVNVAENSTAVATMTATDADLPAQTITYSLSGGVDSALFSITAGGVLTFKLSPDFEAPGDVGANNVYNVQVMASDGNGGTTRMDLAVTVTPVNDNDPVFTSGATAAVNENHASSDGYLSYQLSASDADLPAQSVTFAISGGADRDRFVIRAGNRLDFVAKPNFESPTDANGDNLYEVQVGVTDGQGRSAYKDMFVTVHDDYELSVVAPLPYFSTTASFELTWSAFAAYGSLNSDIASYKVYVHEVGAVEDRLIADTSDTSMIFTGEDGHHYTFYCTSTDLGGNVEPVGEFNTETTIDVVVDVVFSPVQPYGSSVYDWSFDTEFASEIDFADVDYYRIPMEQGQSLSVVITPSVAGTPDQSSPFVVANIHDGNGKLINFEPSSPGQSTVLQSAPASQSGIWMLETAAISGFGNYHVQMYLNAAVEEETVLGSTNNGIATAQSIDGSELLLPGGGRRLAAVGGGNGEDWYSFTLNAGERVEVAEIGAGFTARVQLYDGSGQFITEGVGETFVASGNRIRRFISPTTGTYYARVTASADYRLLVNADASFESEVNDEITTGSSSKHDLSSGLAEIGSLGRDRTDYPRESVRVAIHAGATGYKLLDQLNAAGDIHAVRVTGEEIDTLEELAAYDVVILGDETVEAEMDGFAPALRTWVETAQGGVIGTGWLIYAAGAFTGDPVADIDAIIPIDLTAPEYYTFGGTVHREPVSHPITLVTPDFQLNSDYEFADGPIDDGATTLATVGGVPFVVAANPGSGGRSVWLAPAYFDDSDTNQVRTGPAATLLTRAVYWAGAVGPDRGDFYKIYTPPGDTVVISTETPGGDLLNTLVPTIELYAPTGELVASNSRGADDGRNARLEYSIPAEVNGYYSVRVSTESGSGDYVLRASGGYEIPDAPLTLSAFSPANGAVLTTFPSTITLFASEALNFSSLSADDVTINGQPATSVARQGGRGLSINTAGFNTGDGIYTVAIAAGALRDLQGQPNVAFSMTFTYDSAAPASSVEELPATVIGTDVNLHWSGTDAGAGIATYSIYVSDNDGPYTPFLLNTTSTSAVFVGEDQHTYRFYSVATDQVGRIEAAPEFPDAVTTVQVNGYSPVFTSPDNFEIAENSTEVAVVTATDDDVPVQTVTFSITGGADQSLFSISSDGVLTFNSAPDFENPEDADGDNVYEIQLTADDGLGGTAVQDLTIFVSPVNEFRPEFHSPDSVTVPENSTAILTADATDDDLPVQSVSFSIVGGADEAWFQITPRGILSFVTPRNFEQPVDANGDNLYEVQILADDGDGGTTLQDITVQVTNVNESPVGLALSANTIGEILPAGTTIGQFNTQDPDTADSFTYSLVAGDTASFEIVSNQLRSAVVFDFEVKNSYTVTVQTTDAGGLSFTKSFAVTILDRFGAPPVLTLPVAAVSYTENTAALPVNATAVVADVDSPNFDGGQLTASIASNAQPLDRLRVRNQGTTAGLIGVTGATVTYGGVVLGTISGGNADNSPLVVTLNTTATPAAVAALLKNITFENVGDDPTALTRAIRFTLTDGDGENSLPVERQVKVVPVNDAPVVATSTGTAVYTENAAAEIIDPQIVITDIDSPDFLTGSLKITITTGILSTDRLTIVSEGTGTGKFSFSGVDVFYGGVSIGTFAGGFTTSGALTITFNNPSLPATPAMVQALARRIGFTNTGDNPTATPRTISFVVNDGDGKSSVAATRQVAIQEVNDAPVIATTAGTATYTENALPVVVFASGTVTDADSTNFDTGTLTVDISSGADAADRLQIRNIGVAAGQIGVTGNVITYGGVTIGTFTGGVTDNSPLVVTLNASANAAAVSALVKAVAFSVAGDAPVAGSRVIRSVVTDGDGGTSLPSLRNFTVVAVNDAPKVVTSAGAASYIENAASAPIDAGMVITDVDSSDFAAGTFKATLTGGVTTDRLTILPEGGAVGQIDLVGTTVRYSGIAIGTYTGGFTTSGALTITFNANSSPAAAQALARRIGFHNTGDNPTAATRTVSFVLTDGDGGTSVASTRQIAVTPVNDAPTIGSFGADVTHTEGGATTTLAATATVVDVDSTNFNGGRLVVSLVTGGTADDLLAITNQGTTAGKIGVAGTDVTYGGIVIGSFSGGTGGTALTVTFNSSATTAAVQALVRTITYKLTGTITANGQRRVRFSLTDDLGAASLDLEKNINLLNT